MDIFAHVLWTYIVFHRSEFIWLALLLGILPDILSWGVYMFAPKKGFNWEKPELYKIPFWAHLLYGITHSIFTVSIIFLFTFLFLGKIPIFLLAWPMHILIDVPTHSRKFLPTPFLWPFSKWTFNGISWGTKYFMMTNYTLIIISIITIMH